MFGGDDKLTFADSAVANAMLANAAAAAVAAVAASATTTTTTNTTAAAAAAAMNSYGLYDLNMNFSSSNNNNNNSSCVNGLMFTDVSLGGLNCGWSTDLAELVEYKLPAV